MNNRGVINTDFDDGLDQTQRQINNSVAGLKRYRDASSKAMLRAWIALFFTIVIFGSLFVILK